MKRKIVTYKEETISEELRNKYIEFLKSNEQTVYWDYNDQLSLEQIKKAMNDPEGWINLENDIWENNIDYICTLEYELIKKLKEEFSELQDFDNSELREEFLDYLSVDLNIKNLIRNTNDVRIRVVLHSNMEGIGWTDREGDISFKKNEYVKQIRKLLKGKYEEKSFQQELDNICSSVNQFIFYFKAPIESLMNIKDNWKSITIPKEAWAGFYDSWNGSGSVLEIKLTDDITIKRQYGKTEYDKVSIVLDQASKYSVEETYGLCGVPSINIITK